MKLQAAPPTRTRMPWVASDFYSITVEQYHQMIDAGILLPEDRVELLDGCLVKKMSNNPEHAFPITRLNRLFFTLLPTGWHARIQSPITLNASEPEPDVSVARGSESKYAKRHPYPADIGLVIEVANESLQSDRKRKSMIYAQAGIPEYWIVNVKAGTVEVYSKPTNGKANRYRLAKTYKKADAVPLILDGKKITEIPVRELFQ